MEENKIQEDENIFFIFKNKNVSDKNVLKNRSREKGVFLSK
jgi:hypothetical protein